MGIDKFIEAILNEDFKIAHELLEDEWKEYKKNNLTTEAKAVQGLINGATSLALYKLGRIDAHKRVWKVYEKYINLLENVNLKEIKKYKEASQLLEYKKSKLPS